MTQLLKMDLRQVLLAVLLCLLLPSSCVGSGKPIVTKPKPSWSLISGKSSNRTFEPLTIPLPSGITGAESLAFDRKSEGPYAGVSDGRILKFDRSANAWITFAHTANYSKVPLCDPSNGRLRPASVNETICGRPLGLQFHARTRDLYIADAYLGLMKVGPHGGEAEANGVLFNFVNGLDVDHATGDVYFTDSSTTYQRRNNVMILRHRDATGRLLRYDARARRATVLRDRLPYPNGVAVSADGTHVVVAHTSPCRAFRYWIKGAKAGRYELFADLPGFPDNVRGDSKGGYWIAMNQEKVDFNATTTTPPPSAKPHLVGVHLDGSGAELQVMTAPRGVTLSDVAERDGKQLWLGSVELGYVGLVDNKMLR